MDTHSDGLWKVPYLPIDPNDVGRTYKAIIRINSQSGKGGIAYVMDREFGLELPKNMYPEFGNVVNQIADQLGKELSATEIHKAFSREYLELEMPLSLVSHRILTIQSEDSNVQFSADIIFHACEMHVEGAGNGPIAAFVDALERSNLKNFRLTDFRQHAITRGSAADAAAYVEIERSSDRKVFWGASIDGNIELAGLKALVSAYNRANRD